MAVMAFGDESVRWTGVPEPAYLLGAYVCEEDDDTLTDSLAHFARGSKLQRVADYGGSWDRKAHDAK